MPKYLNFAMDPVDYKLYRRLKRITKNKTKITHQKIHRFGLLELLKVAEIEKKSADKKEA